MNAFFSKGNSSSHTPTPHRAFQRATVQYKIFPNYRRVSSTRKWQFIRSACHQRASVLKTKFSKGLKSLGTSFSYFISSVLRISASSPGKSSTSVNSSGSVFSSYCARKLGSWGLLYWSRVYKIIRNRVCLFLRLKFAEETKVFASSSRDCKTWFDDWLNYGFNSKLHHLGTA